MSDTWAVFCLDNGFTEEDLKKAWNKGKTKNFILENLSNHGKDYKTLNKSCLKDLMKKYGEDAGNES